jgi:hypothetical protein
MKDLVAVNIVTVQTGYGTCKEEEKSSVNAVIN